MPLQLQTGTVDKPPRIILLGVEKIGKSTFAAGAPNAVFLPIKGEEGIDGIGAQRFAPAQNWAELINNLKALSEEEHDRKTVVIDSASALEPLLWQAVCEKAQTDSIEKVGGGYGKGYTEAVGYWHELCDWLDYLRETKGMGAIIIGHVKTKRHDDPTGESYDRYQMDCNDKASARLFRWADAILFANTKAIVKKEDVGFNKTQNRAIDPSGGARYLFTQQRPAHPGGGRYPWGNIAYELPLDYAQWHAAVEQVKQPTQEK
jgi:hypothetical protein